MVDLLQRTPQKDSWIERLPAPMRAAWKRSWIRRAAMHLAEKGMQPGHAIATAVNAAKKGCATGDLNYPGLQQVNVGSKAEMCAAVTLWESMKAAAKTDTSIPARDRRVLELAFERIDREAVELASEKRGPLRRLRDLVRRAIVADHLLEFAPSTAEREAARKKGQALPGKDGGAPRFPVRNRADLDKAVRAVGRARPKTEEERAKVRRFLIRRARALNATDLIPDSWNSDGSLKS